MPTAAVRPMVAAHAGKNHEFDDAFDPGTAEIERWLRIVSTAIPVGRA